MARDIALPPTADFATEAGASLLCGPAVFPLSRPDVALSKAGFCTATNARLFDHLGSEREQRRRDGDPDRLRFSRDRTEVSCSTGKSLALAENTALAGRAYSQRVDRAR